MLYPAIRRAFASRSIAREPVALESVAYRPPYASPVHDAFAWHAAKHVRSEVTITADAPLAVGASGVGGDTRADFLLESRGTHGVRRIAVELGGARSLREHMSQRRRDAKVVASGAADAVYRLAATDLAASIDDALYLIAAWEHSSGAGRHVTDVFSTRGRLNLARLASEEALEASASRAQAVVLLHYGPGPAGASEADRVEAPADLPYLLVRRFDRRFPAAWAIAARRSYMTINTFLRPTGT